MIASILAARSLLHSSAGPAEVIRETQSILTFAPGMGRLGRRSKRYHGKRSFVHRRQKATRALGVVDGLAALPSHPARVILGNCRRTRARAERQVARSTRAPDPPAARRARTPADPGR